MIIQINLEFNKMLNEASGLKNESLYQTEINFESMYQRKNYKMFYIQVVISLWCVPISWNMNNSYKLLTYLLRNELHTRNSDNNRKNK